MPLGKQFVSVEVAQRKLEYYCVYQERCHKEVAQKLSQLGMVTEAKEKIITHLISEGYLNETRFAKAYVKGKFHQKKWGRLRLHNGLKEKQISAYNCKLALAQISEKEYLNTFNTLAQTRWQALEKETSKPKKKQKFISYLQYRGWESHLIWEALVALEKV